MKKFNAKLLFFIIIIVVLAAAIIFIVLSSNKKQTVTQQVATSQLNTATPISTADPSTYSDINVPDGVTVVQTPAGSGDTYIGSNSSSTNTGTETSSSTNNNIYIVDAPTDSTTSSNSNSGIYVVTTPSGSSSSNNDIYVVNTPSGGSSSSDGIYVVNTPSGGGSYDDGSASGTIIRNGAFSGSNGGLTLNVSYTIMTISASRVQVSMTASLTHGNLYSNAEPLSFSCYGQYGTVTASAVSGAGNTFLGTKTFTVNLAQGESTTMNLGATWNFNGSYSGKNIDSVSASSTATVYR